MRRLIFAAAALAALVGAFSAFADNGNHGHGTTTLRLVEQLTTPQSYAPAGATSPIGDRLIWSAGIYDRRGNQVGKDTAECTVITADFLVQCVFSVTLPGGEMTVQGMGQGTDTVFAITGGTGAYKDVRGEVRAVDTTPGVRAELTFTLVNDD
jgi:hypothetical protein